MSTLTSSLKCLLAIVILLTGSAVSISQTPIISETNSSVFKPHLSLIEDGEEDFARIKFSNNVAPNRYWMIRGGTLQADPRISFFYQGNLLMREVLTISGFGLGRVGVNQPNPQAALHVFGNVRIDSLIGVGNAAVWVDSNGSLQRRSQTIHFNPTHAIGVTDAPKKWIIVEPTDPRPAIKVSTDSLIVSSEPHYVHLPLTLPDGVKIKSVQVCYTIQDTTDAVVASIYAIRLTKMGVPDAYEYFHEEITNITSSSGCYTSNVAGSNNTVENTVSLEIQVTLGLFDTMLIGNVAVSLE